MQDLDISKIIHFDDSLIIQDFDDIQKIKQEQSDSEFQNFSDQQSSSFDSIEFEENQHYCKVEIPKQKFELRQYQIDIFQKAKDKNSIIYLETGTGKTVISIMLMNYYLKKFNFEKKIIFLTTTIQLVEQQTQEIFEKMPLVQESSSEIMGQEKNREKKNIRIQRYHGMLGENDKKFDICELYNAEIIVITPQILLNGLRKGQIQLSQFGFIVFDECHHTKSDHPYKNIITEFYILQKKRYLRDESNFLPYICGLTASPLTIQINFDGKKEQIFDNISTNLQELQINLDSHYIYYNNNEINQYINQCQVTQEFYEQDFDFDYSQNINFQSQQSDYLNQEINQNYPWLYGMIQDVQNFKDQFDNNNFEINQIFTDLFFILQRQSLVILSELGLMAFSYYFEQTFCQVYTKIQRIQLEDPNKLTLLRDIIKYFQKCQIMINDCYGSINEENISKKFAKLIDIIQKNIKNNDANILVYAERRLIVQYLNLILSKIFKINSNQIENEIDESTQDDIMTNYIVGSQTIKRNQAQNIFQKVIYSEKFLQTQQILNQLQQDKIDQQQFIKKNKNKIQNFVYNQDIGQIQQIINDFSKKKIKILITTSVAEEGFDIPSCDYVIAYNNLQSIRQYVQLKGRARKQNSNFILLQQKEKQTQIKAFEQTVKIIKKICFEQNEKKSRFYLDEEQTKNYAINYEYKIVEKTKAIINSNWSINLLNRYCSILKHNQQAGFFQPIYHYYHIQGIGFKCIIQMPLNSKIRFFTEGDFFKSKDESKRNSTYKAVIQLYREQSFSPYLKPLSNLNDEAQDQEIEGNNNQKKFFKDYKTIMENEVKKQIEEQDGIQVKKFHYPSIQNMIIYNQFFNINTKQEFEDNSSNFLNLSKFDVIMINIKMLNSNYMFEQEDLKLGLICQADLITKEMLQYSTEFKKNKYFLEMTIQHQQISIDEQQKDLIIQNYFFLANSINDTEVECLSLLLKQKINDLGSFSFLQKKNKMRRQQEPQKLELNKNFPMLTVLDNNGDIDWEFLKNTQKYINMLKQNFTILNDSKPEQKQIVFSNQASVYNNEHIYQNILTLQKSLITKKLNFESVPSVMIPRLNKLKEYTNQQIFDLYSVHGLKKPLSKYLEDGKDNFLSNFVDSNNNTYKYYFDKELLMFPYKIKIFACAKIFLQEFFYKIRDKIKAKVFREKVLKQMNKNFVAQIGKNEIQAIQFQSSPSYLLTNHSTILQIPEIKTYFTYKIQKNLDFKPIKINKYKYQYFNFENDKIDLNLLEQTLKTSMSDSQHNSESLEFYGDSILKYLTSIYVFFQYQDGDENLLTQKRVDYISNKYLKVVSIGNRFFEYMIMEKQQLLIPGIQFLKLNQLYEHHHWIPDKTLADLVEALIALYYINYNNNLNACIAFLHMIGIIDQPTIKIQQNYQNFYDRQLLDHFSQLEDYIGYKFKDKSLLVKSFTHYSFKLYIEHQLTQNVSIEINKAVSDIQENMDQSINNIKQNEKQLLEINNIKPHEISYERLEFLGDAILDMFIAEYLFQNNPDFTAGDLTKNKHALVNNTLLSLISLYHNFDNFVLVQDMIIFKQNTEIIKLNLEFYMKNLDQYYKAISSKAQVKKVMADVVEAIIGAIFIDSDLNYDVTKQFILNIFGPFLESQIRKTMSDIDPQAKLCKMMKNLNIEYDLVCISDDLRDSYEYQLINLKDNKVLIRVQEQNKEQAIRLIVDGLLKAKEFKNKQIDTTVKQEYDQESEDIVDLKQNNSQQNNKTTQQNNIYDLFDFSQENHIENLQNSLLDNYQPSIKNQDLKIFENQNKDLTDFRQEKFHKNNNLKDVYKNEDLLDFNYDNQDTYQNLPKFQKNEDLFDFLDLQQDSFTINNKDFSNIKNVQNDLSEIQFDLI